MLFRRIARALVLCLLISGVDALSPQFASAAEETSAKEPAKDKEAAPREQGEEQEKASEEKAEADEKAPETLTAKAEKLSLEVEVSGSFTQMETMPFSLKKAEIALEKQRTGFEQSAKKLDEMKADAALLTIKAKMDGVVYYGAFDGPKYKGIPAEKRPRAGKPWTSGDAPIMTIV